MRTQARVFQKSSGLLFLLVGLLMAAPQEPNTPESESFETDETKKTERVMVIPLSDDKKFMVDEVQSEFINAALDRAEEEGYSRVVLEIDTNGGIVYYATAMTERLLRMKIPTTAFVLKKAISAGTFIAWTCDDIVMAPLTNMGDAQVIMQTQDGIEEAPEKFVSVYRADWKKASREKGRSFALARGFFDVSAEVMRVGTESQFSFITRADYDRLPQDKQLPILEIICEKDHLLTLDAADWQRLGIATIHEDVATYLETLGFGPDQIERVDMKTNQSILRYIGSNKWIFILLTMIGLNGLYMELKAPGFGIPGLTAIVCFTLVFGSRYFLGTANSFEIGLFVVGLLLCMVEIFVLPGFGVAGLAGLAAVFGALLLASLPDFGGFPKYDFQFEMVNEAMLSLATSFVLSIVIFIALVPLMFKLPAVNRMMLPNDMKAENGFVMDTVSAEDDLVGSHGKAQGGLRPSGKVLLDDGRFLDVVSDGTYVDDGLPVEIIKVDGNRIIVRPTVV